MFGGLEGTQVVFHGINKSGSLAMANVLGEGFEAAGRSADFISHYHTGGTSKKFVAKANKARGSKFVVGHYLFGALEPRPGRIWITQFRHPLPRVLSCYQWLKNKHRQTAEAGEPYPTLEQFVLKAKGSHHSQIRQFGIGFGQHRRNLAKRLSPRDLFEISVDAIERDVYAIGIAEYFEESIFVFARLCGLPSVAPWVRDNRNPGRTLAHDLSVRERDLIHEVFNYDFKLYNWALKRFQDQISGMEFGAGMQDYKLACANQYKDRIT